MSRRCVSVTFTDVTDYLYHCDILSYMRLTVLFSSYSVTHAQCLTVFIVTCHLPRHLRVIIPIVDSLSLSPGRRLTPALRTVRSVSFIYMIDSEPSSRPYTDTRTYVSFHRRLKRVRRLRHHRYDRASDARLHTLFRHPKTASSSSRPRIQRSIARVHSLYEDAVIHRRLPEGPTSNR